MLSADEQYKNIAKRIVETGDERPDRTGVGTFSLFGEQVKFDLRGWKVPLLTTKKVFWKGVVEELLWFIRGDTSSKSLEAKGVNIWKGNTSREALDNIGLSHLPEGEGGRIYGLQWRRFGCEYKQGETGPSPTGVDQLANAVHLLRTDPYSRRICVTAWDPKSLDNCCLPPCHSFFQFYVTSKNELCCHLYQRSCDLGLGAPFNWAGYSLLTMLVAKVTDLTPGDLIISYGDVHIYKNHVEGIKEQIARTPRNTPTVELADKKELWDFTYEDITLVGYKPHPLVKLPFAV